MGRTSLSLEEIYEAYAQRVRNFLVSKCHDAFLADELTAEVFVKVCEKIDTYDDTKAELSTWIFTIARNKLIDHYRSNRVLEEIPETFMSGESIEDDFCTNESLEVLAEAMQTLDKRQRYIIVERYYRNSTLKDIADALGISYSYVKVLHKDALAELRDQLQDFGVLTAC